MEKTFETTKRYTLTHLPDYANSEKPARFTEGICRDIHCEQLAWKSMSTKSLEDKVLVLLDDAENCIGYHFFHENLSSDDSLTSYHNTPEIIEYVLAFNAKKVMIVFGEYFEHRENDYTPMNYNDSFVPDVAKTLELINVELIEYRAVKKDRSYQIRTGDE